MSWAKGVETAQGTERGEFLPQGTFDCEVVYTDSVPKRSGGTFVKAHVKILSSTNDAVKVGDERDMGYNVGGDPDSNNLALADLRNLVMAIENVAAAEVTEETLLFIFTRKNNACVGKKFRVVASTIQTKKGNQFTKYVCRPYATA